VQRKSTSAVVDRGNWHARRSVTARATAPVCPARARTLSEDRCGDDGAVRKTLSRCERDPRCENDVWCRLVLAPM